MNKLSSAKRALVISLLCEGTPINATERILKTSKRAILRVIRETGAALADYMDSHFVNIPCERLEVDEAWSYVFKHGQRIRLNESSKEIGDYWLWCAVDPDTKLIVSHRVARRDWNSGQQFLADAGSRITGPVQVTSDRNRGYALRMRKNFHQDGMSYVTEKKQFPKPYSTEEWVWRRQNGIQKICTVERKAVVGTPDLATATTSHVERVFLTVRQELKRFQRLGLGYSKKLAMHRYGVAMTVGVYNLCRSHKGLANFTPAMAAGLASKKWTTEDVVALTDRFLRAREDAKFERAWASRHNH
ncbi:MAG: hypothetical protein P4L99_29290 [Chthoniobacter sp.]|nr:hypothetical protein [Chthoniobacter sp.]